MKSRCIPSTLSILDRFRLENKNEQYSTIGLTQTIKNDFSFVLKEITKNKGKRSPHFRCFSWDMF